MREILDSTAVFNHSMLQQFVIKVDIEIALS